MKFMTRLAMFVLLGTMITSCSGCYVFGSAVVTAVDWSKFWITTPPIPVPAYFSQQIEDTYWEEERYNKVPILDPVEGENAPLFCLDPPSPDEVMRSLPDKAAGGFAFLAETARNNVRIVVEPIVDRVDECRFYPLVGPARLHHCHYKCTVYYDKTIRSSYPVPFTFEDETQEVVYIDHDHLIRCSGPDAP
jgi:hypothetical protein